VVSGVGTVQDYFKEDELTFYPHNDPQALARQIVELYRNPARRVDLARRARIAFRSYEWPQMRTRYYRVLDRLLCE
jgi:glycosyltransferase involved in cell wall biosynthesis